MIGRISGLLLEKHPPLVLVDAQGVGYEINVPMSTFCQLPAIGERLTLQTHLIVREDAHVLFGFVTEGERALFRQLTKITGVGARTALAILSGMSVTDLCQAVALQDGAWLTKIPGIGKKTAERLLLELRDKLDSTLIQPGTTSISQGIDKDILNALLSLGYNAREASLAVKQLPDAIAVSDGIMQALQYLSKPK